MKKKLSKEAINEIVGLLKEVKEVVSLLRDMGIRITSDPWEATSFDDSENILVWKREDFEKINEDISDGDIFYIGGNVITGGEHQYKDEWIIAPKELAKVQGEIFEKYLQSIVNSTSLKYFNLELKNPYGLTDNCGWENWFVIETTVKNSALINDNKTCTKNLIKKISDEYECYVYTAFDDEYDNYSSVSNITGYDDELACCIEIFSDLVDPNDYKESNFGITDEYINDIVKVREETLKESAEIEVKYNKYAVKTTVSKWNEGCQYGMAIYVWIPYQ